MQIIAAIEYDRLRQEPGTWNKVILHREGKFYRAYEWSAWLIKTVVCTEAFQKERGDAKPLSCHRQKNKSGEFAMLGFPVESISKFIPTHKDMYPLPDSPDDIGIEIDIPLQGDETYDQLRHRTRRSQHQLLSRCAVALIILQHPSPSVRRDIRRHHQGSMI